jgi:hypothetical protein
LERRSDSLDRLEKAADAHFNPSILLRPAWDLLRPDPHFEALVHRIGIANPLE